MRRRYPRRLVPALRGGVHYRGKRGHRHPDTGQKGRSTRAFRAGSRRFCAHDPCPASARDRGAYLLLRLCGPAEGCQGNSAGRLPPREPPAAHLAGGDPSREPAAQDHHALRRAHGLRQDLPRRDPLPRHPAAAHGRHRHDGLLRDRLRRAGRELHPHAPAVRRGHEHCLRGHRRGLPRRVRQARLGSEQRRLLRARERRRTYQVSASSASCSRCWSQ